MKNIMIPLVLMLTVSLSSCTDKSADKVAGKRVVTLSTTPASRPYSPAVEAGNMLFVSGQIAVDPVTGKLIEGGIEEQTRQVLENLTKVIETAGYKRENVVKCTVLMTDITHYQVMNKIYMEFFPSEPPARAAFAVKDLPMGALIEIEAIAVR
ncbi:MAG TPA: Rid family detoxifying hydrolase [Bacteroidales bacterium]|nr:Rid family detoxifying hydrolase [Bacteroidales bacterium]HRT88771.1 Rid family detoxifying hydrolase [Bacteroidales bacterium]